MDRINDKIAGVESDDDSNNGDDNSNNGGDDDGGDDGMDESLLPFILPNTPIVPILLTLYRFVKLHPTYSIYLDIYLIKVQNILNKLSLKLITFFNSKILVYLRCIFIGFVLYILCIYKINLFCDAPRA
jgi:hypothetical protein